MFPIRLPYTSVFHTAKKSVFICFTCMYGAFGPKNTQYITDPVDDFARNFRIVSSMIGSRYVIRVGARKRYTA